MEVSIDNAAVDFDALPASLAEVSLASSLDYLPNFSAPPSSPQDPSILESVFQSNGGKRRKSSIPEPHSFPPHSLPLALAGSTVRSSAPAQLSTYKPKDEDGKQHPFISHAKSLDELLRRVIVSPKDHASPRIHKHHHHHHHHSPYGYRHLSHDALTSSIAKQQRPRVHIAGNTSLPVSATCPGFHRASSQSVAEAFSIQQKGQQSGSLPTSMAKPCHLSGSMPATSDRTSNDPIILTTTNIHHVSPRRSAFIMSDGRATSPIPTSMELQVKPDESMSKRNSIGEEERKMDPLIWQIRGMDLQR
ncbi:hypothetical protein BZG36_04856 [Bifiguratus adelaidae]|uniref:Uncharacterized protein n=1 Tax=Bifiguratus adelaidae TaxID=1938954 RepID=A0A261XVM6_9FUNG|nr:hypothetical protein BZG36_04856 [Bifiguratus adelaidae]